MAPATAQELYQQILKAQRGFDVAPKFTSVLYGGLGSGKTVLTMKIAQLITPPDKRIYMVDTSEGYVSLNNHPELKERVQPMASDLSMAQLIFLTELIRQDVNGFGEYRTIVIDELNPIVRNQVLEVGKARERRQSAKGDLKLDEDALDIRDYGLAQNKLAPLWKALLSLQNVNLLFTAHSRKAEENGITVTTADFPQAIRKDVVRFSHILGHRTATLQKDGSYKRETQVLPTTTVEARTRVKLPDVKVSDEQLLDGITAWMQSDSVSKDPMFNGYEIPGE